LLNSCVNARQWATQELTCRWGVYPAA